MIAAPATSDPERLLTEGVRRAMRVVDAQSVRAAPLGTPIDPEVGAAAQPVLLVHGYGNSSASMSAIERSLERDGFRAFSVDLPDNGFGDGMSDARFLMSRVRGVQAATGASSVDIVGHSRGGLVARAADQLLDRRDAVRRVITVASANQGLDFGAASPVVGAVLPQGIRDMRHGSELIERLHRSRAGADVVAVGTNGFDGLVLPTTAERIESAPWIPVDVGRTVGPLSRLDHWELLRDGPAYEAIRGALLTGG